MSQSALEEGLATDVASLQGLDLEALRRVWVSRFSPPAPPLRSGDLMRRRLAEKMQMEALGGDPDLDEELARMARGYGRGRTIKKPAPRIKAGAVIVREYQGRIHRVEALAEGFAWNGRTWRSLSEIAREITGVRWNGPRFFGLRETEASR